VYSNFQFLKNGAAGQTAPYAGNGGMFLMFLNAAAPSRQSSHIFAKTSLVALTS
jgi:hypothetical protein